MKGRLLAFFFLTALILSGCSCDHVWSEADCLNPAVCINCEEIGSHALGHEWSDATCTEAKTCIRCGATDADPLGHSFGDWTFTGDQMSHTCANCALEEKTDIDRALYLETLLTGSWNLFGITHDDVIDYASQSNFVDLYFNFGTDGVVSFHLPDTLTQKGTWRFDSYEVTDACDIYRFTLECSDNTYSMQLRYQDIRDTMPDKLLAISISQQEYYMAQCENAEKNLVSIWGIQSNTAGTSLGNPRNWLRFHADRTVEGYLNGNFEGVWHIYPRVYNTVHKADPTSFGIVIENTSEAEVQIFHGILSTYDEIGLDLKINGRYQSFGQIDEEHLADIIAASERHLGTWVSTEIRYLGNFERYSADYSITFHEDNTVTANFGKELTGVWMLDPHYWDDYLGQPQRDYSYNVQFESSKEIVSCHINDGRLTVSSCSQLNDRIIDCVQLTADEGNMHLQGTVFPIGNWTSYYYWVRNASDRTQVQEDIFTDEYSFSFHNDGTFTGILDEAVSGTWRYEYHVSLYDDSVKGSPWYSWDYQITLQDDAETRGECRSDGDNTLFFIAVPHPENEDLEIVYAMLKNVP